MTLSKIIGKNVCKKNFSENFFIVKKISTIIFEKFIVEDNIYNLS